MTTDVLRERTGRYLCGQAVPAETKQIQNWLSCTGEKNERPLEERSAIEEEILQQVKAYVASSSMEASGGNWWRKFTAAF